jgi:hypothetical protein
VFGSVRIIADFQIRADDGFQPDGKPEKGGGFEIRFFTGIKGIVG